MGLAYGQVNGDSLDHPAPINLKGHEGMAMEKQYSYKRIQKHVENVLKHRLNGSPFPEFRNIEDCKTEIESWYEWGSFNNFLIRGLDQEDAQAKLEKLKNLKSEREPFYTSSDENVQILNLICEHPDVMASSQIKKTRQDRLTLDRDYRDRKWKTIVNEFLKAKERIEEKIRKENEKLLKKDTFFKIKQPFEVSVKSDVEQTHIIPAQKSFNIEREIKRFLKELSVTLFPSYPIKNQRAEKIRDILRVFYGISKTLADPDNIRKHIKGEIL